MIEQINYVGKLVRFRNNTSQPKRVKHHQGSMLYLDGEFQPYRIEQVEIIEETPLVEKCLAEGATFIPDEHGGHFTMSVPGSNPGGSADVPDSEAQVASVPDHGQEERAPAAGTSPDRRIQCDNCGSDDLRVVCDNCLFSNYGLRAVPLETQVLERAMFGQKPPAFVTRSWDGKGLQTLADLQIQCTQRGRDEGLQLAASEVEAFMNEEILKTALSSSGIRSLNLQDLAYRIRRLQSPQQSEAENLKT